MSDRLTTTGLSESEAQQRLTEDGPNVIGGRTRPPTLTVALDALREPMFIMLVAGGGLYLAMGKLSDGLLLFPLPFKPWWSAHRVCICCQLQHCEYRTTEVLTIMLTFFLSPVGAI